MELMTLSLWLRALLDQAGDLQSPLAFDPPDRQYWYRRPVTFNMSESADRP